jgi:hypothetical protein
MCLPGLPGYAPRGTRDRAGQARLSFAELDTAIGAFLIGVYNLTPHSETGQPPQARWEAGGFLPAGELSVLPPSSRRGQRRRRRTTGPRGDVQHRRGRAGNQTPYADALTRAAGTTAWLRGPAAPGCSSETA